MTNIKRLVSCLNRDIQRELNEYLGISNIDKIKKSIVIHQIKQKFINSDIFMLGLASKQRKKCKKLELYYVESISGEISCFYELFGKDSKHWYGWKEERTDPFVKDILFSRDIHQYRFKNIKPSGIKDFFGYS